MYVYIHNSIYLHYITLSLEDGQDTETNLGLTISYKMRVKVDECYLSNRKRSKIWFWLREKVY